MWLAITLLLSVVGIIIGWLALRSRKPRYATCGVNLVSSSLASFDDLTISYRGKPVTQVTLTAICFYNEGRQAIRPSDLVESDPIRVSVPTNFEILDCVEQRCSIRSDS
jgi:hypothetical protein